MTRHGELLDGRSNTVVDRLVREDCINCGVVYALPVGLWKHRKSRGEYIYCPNGHAQHYTKTEAMRLQAELDQVKAHRRTLEAEVTRLTGSVLDKAKELSTTTKELKAIKRRVGAGICPCCNRQFGDLARHMKSKHKEMAPDVTRPAVEPQ